MIPGSAYSVRPARPGDTPRIVRLLPFVLLRPQSVSVLVLERRDGAFAGCATLERDFISWKLAPEVCPEETLPELLTALRIKALQSGLRCLRTREAFVDSAPEAALLVKAGFQRSEGFIYTEYAPAEAVGLFEKGMEILHRRRSLPADAKVIALRHAPAIPVRQLVKRHFGEMPECHQDPGFFEEKSKVALHGPKVVGVILMDLIKDETPCPLVTRMAVEEAYRGKWVYVLLMHAVHVDFMQAGFARVVSKTNPKHHAGIINFIRRAQGHETRREFHYSKRLD